MFSDSSDQTYPPCSEVHQEVALVYLFFKANSSLGGRISLQSPSVCFPHNIQTSPTALSRRSQMIPPQRAVGCADCQADQD